MLINLLWTCTYLLFIRWLLNSELILCTRTLHHFLITVYFCYAVWSNGWPASMGSGPSGNLPLHINVLRRTMMADFELRQMLQVNSARAWCFCKRVGRLCLCYHWHALMWQADTCALYARSLLSKLNCSKEVNNIVTGETRGQVPKNITQRNTLPVHLKNAIWLLQLSCAILSLISFLSTDFVSSAFVVWSHSHKRAIYKFTITTTTTLIKSFWLLCAFLCTCFGIMP